MESEPEHHENRNELSNSDQMSLMNTVIDRALERQRKFLIDHIDSKLDTVTMPVPATVDEFDFRQEGKNNTIFTITMLDIFPHMSVFHQERT
jgi:hypothetical protein